MMKDFFSLKWFINILILIIVLTGCAQMKTGSPSKTSIQTPAQKPIQKTSPQAAVQEPVQSKLPQMTGDYQKTIDAYKAEQTKHPHDQSLTKDYAKSLDEMKVDADYEYEKENYPSACKTYSILMKNYPGFRPFAHMLSFNKQALNKKLTDCKTTLSKKGFHEYREGNLNEAITLWQGYLVIDPNNTDIRKAVNTAKLQQKNLQQTK